MRLLLLSLLLVALTKAEDALTCARNRQCQHPETKECVDLGVVINGDSCNPKECTVENNAYGFRYQSKFRCTYVNPQTGQSECKEQGEIFTEGCLRRRCLPAKRDGRTYYYTPIIRYACKDSEGNCRGWRKVWSTKKAGKYCAEYKCIWWRVAHVPWPYKFMYKNKVLKYQCIDSTEECHDIGASGFSTTQNGVVYNNCECRFENSKLVTSCKP